MTSSSSCFISHKSLSLSHNCPYKIKFYFEGKSDDGRKLDPSTMLDTSIRRVQHSSVIKPQCKYDFKFLSRYISQRIHTAAWKKVHFENVPGARTSSSNSIWSPAPCFRAFWLTEIFPEQIKIAFCRRSLQIKVFKLKFNKSLITHPHVNLNMNTRLKLILAHL